MSALAFLAENHFDFNKSIYDGLYFSAGRVANEEKKVSNAYVAYKTKTDEYFFS